MAEKKTAGPRTKGRREADGHREEAPGADSLRGDLFIVDNSDAGWTGLRYLEEWTGIARAFDIATGFFEIGSLLALDGKWQELEKLRILMGAETTASTKQALLEAVTGEAVQHLDQSLEDAKLKNPFLRDVPGVLEALKSNQIECRVYDKAKFHAKAYITHGKLDVVGSQALVGSSNFTRPGLTENVELNIQIQSRTEVETLQRWFEEHWADGSEVTEAVVKTIARHTRAFSPFEVYAKALQEFFRGHELTASEWDETRSQIFPKLDRYQQEAYSTQMKIAQRFGGAFLCDGVGLGKTFVGLMLIERLVLREGKRVVLFAPKATKQAVWDPLIREHLSHIGGGADFSNLAVFSHTDLGRKGEFPARFRRIAELADAVIIDEAHHFRNPGRAGADGDVEKESRYHRLFRLLDPKSRPKSVFLLTATPINNRLTDFRHMTELFSRREEAYFARTLGINNLRAHFANLEKELRQQFEGHDVNEAGAVTEAAQVLASSETFKELVVQRSRAYAVESQRREKGAAAMFPKRRPPTVAKYSIKKSYGKLLDDVETAFSKDKPLFSLAVYYPLAYYKGPDESVDPFEENRQNQVLHSPSYRARFGEQLARGFPRIPRTDKATLAKEIADLGLGLVSLHLMEGPSIDEPITTYIGEEEPEVERVGWAEDTVWLDAPATRKGQPTKPGTNGFREVPEAVWNFHVGAYQVCRKWLKDRGPKKGQPGMVLTPEDITHYQRIIVVIHETIRIMEEVDECVDAYGGWPAAFSVA